MIQRNENRLHAVLITSFFSFEEKMPAVSLGQGVWVHVYGKSNSVYLKKDSVQVPIGYIVMIFRCVDVWPDYLLIILVLICVTWVMI
jgi:hypothetical protein